MNQLSLSHEAFISWQNIAEQTARTGSVFDPLPASPRDKVDNICRHKELLPGYFGASAASYKRTVIVPVYLNEHLLDGSAEISIEKGDCSKLYSDAVCKLSVPPGWKNAEQSVIY